MMANTYTGQLIKVLWNGVYSQNFPVVNGVKQGGLFCIYNDNVLLTLRQTGVGCFIGSWFVGALAYADDIVLMAPTATAMRQLLAVDVIFNASKSKGILFRPHKTCKYAAMRTPDLSTGGNNTEFVEKWPHLGHMLTLNDYYMST